MAKNLIVTGLQCGDEGKATMLDFLSRYLDTKINSRYQGGGQAAHNGILPNGQHHCFSQLGSGSFVSGLETYLSEYMVVNPVSLVNEANDFCTKIKANIYTRLVIDPMSLVTTPIHMHVNRAREILRGDKRHGTCGKGVGEAVGDENKSFAIRIKDLFNQKLLKEKLTELREQKREVLETLEKFYEGNPLVLHDLQRVFSDLHLYRLLEFYGDFVSGYGIRFEDKSYLQNAIRKGDKIIFEGAQGVLLDVESGFRPYVTKTKTTSINAEAVLSSIGYDDEFCRLGLIRAYTSRHGPGPLVTETPELSEKIVEKHNIPNNWQGAMRYGWLDLVAIRYAIATNRGVDDLAVTCLDQLDSFSEIKVCDSYEYLGNNLRDLSSFFEWEYFSGKRIKILRFKPFCKENKTENLTKLLFECIPLDFMVFPGWHRKINKNLPTEARNYLMFLESKEGLNVRIKFVSIGPTWQDKIIL